MRIAALIGVLATSMALASRATAGIRTKEIEYRHGDTVLQGYLAWDDSVKEKRPGVMVVHEWWGLNDYVKGRAQHLAELGYVAFACDMYGKGIVTTDAAEAGRLAGAIRKDNKVFRERAALGLRTLAEQP